MKQRVCYFLSIFVMVILIGCSDDSDESDVSEWASDCSCSQDLYNCDDFDNEAEAQACYDHCFPTVGDIHQLDSDDDEYPCENSWNSL